MGLRSPNNWKEWDMWDFFTPVPRLLQLYWRGSGKILDRLTDMNLLITPSIKVSRGHSAESTENDCKGKCS